MQPDHTGFEFASAFAYTMNDPAAVTKVLEEKGATGPEKEALAAAARKRRQAEEEELSRLAMQSISTIPYRAPETKGD